MSNLATVTAKTHHLAQRIDGYITAAAARFTSAETRLTSAETRLTNDEAGIAGGSYAIVTNFANSWTVFASRSLGVKTIEGGHAARITGQLTAGGTADGTTVCALPSMTYAPGRLETVLVGFAGGTQNAGAIPYLEIDTGGIVKIYGAGGAAGGHWVVTGTYPLDTTS